MTSPRSIARAAARGNVTKRHHRPAQVRNLRTMGGRVYLASSLHTYRTPEYSEHLDMLARLVPDAEILPARDLFQSNSDWLCRWPEILPTLDAVVYFEDRDGYIGYGVFTEISDALARGIPIYFLTPEGKLREIATDDDGEIIFTALRLDDWRQFAQVAYIVPGAEALDLLGATAKGGG